MNSGGAITAIALVVVTGFAAASTNTVRTRIDSATPADSIVLTVTASTTGDFRATGSTRFELQQTVAVLYNSDDATDPAFIRGWGVEFQFD